MLASEMLGKQHQRCFTCFVSNCNVSEILFLNVYLSISLERSRMKNMTRTSFNIKTGFFSSYMDLYYTDIRRPWLSCLCNGNSCTVLVRRHLLFTGEFPSQRPQEGGGGHFLVNPDMQHSALWLTLALPSPVTDISTVLIQIYVLWHIHESNFTASVCKLLFCIISLKTILFKRQPHLPRANNLTTAKPLI